MLWAARGRRGRGRRPAPGRAGREAQGRRAAPAPGPGGGAPRSVRGGPRCPMAPAPRLLMRRAQWACAGQPHMCAGPASAGARRGPPPPRLAPQVAGRTCPSPRSQTSCRPRGSNRRLLVRAAPHRARTSPEGEGSGGGPCAGERGARWPLVRCLPPKLRGGGGWGAACRHPKLRGGGGGEVGAQPAATQSWGRGWLEGHLPLPKPRALLRGCGRVTIKQR